MKVKHNKTTGYIGLAAVLVLVLLFIPFPQGSTQKAVVMPSAEFQVTASGAGGFSSIFTDLWNNHILSSKDFIPQRGGVIQYERNLELRSETVDSGDTLGWLISSSVLDRIITLEGNISTLKANLEFEQSGSRQTVIQAARLQLDYARTRHAEQLKILDRSAAMLESGIITQEEFEQDQRRERLNAIRISIAEAELGSALSGSKSSKLDIYRTQIADEERKLELARETLASMTLVSPISGKLNYAEDTDILFTLGKLDTVLVLVPLDGATYSMSEWTSDLSLSGTDFSVVLTPDQVKVTEQILGSGTNQMVLIRARLPNPHGTLIPGQFLEASLKFRAKSVFQILKAMF